MSRPHESNPDGYETLDETTLTRPEDPGAQPEDVGIPPTGEDIRAGRGDVPEPMRRSVPTDTPVASLDFGTTAEEEAAGEAHGERLDRENPDPQPERPLTQEETPMGTWQAWDYPESSGIRSGADLTGYRVLARDGEIGRIDEASSEIGASKIVVDTGGWLPGKRVLLPAGVIDTVDDARESVYVNRTRDEIDKAPEYSEEEAENPEYENRLVGYYGGFYGPAITTPNARGNST